MLFLGDSMIFKNRKVIDAEVDGIDASDYPDFCDSYFSSAVWADTGEFLTDDELEELTDECASEKYELIYDKMISAYE